MRISDDELLGLIDELCSALGELLVAHKELQEGFMADNGLQQAQDRIEKKRKEIEGLRDKLRRTKEAIKRKRELERLRKANSGKEDRQKLAEGVEQIRDGKGKLLGYRVKERNRITYLDKKGRLAAREHGGKTYDKNGVFSGNGAQGLRFLSDCPK